MGKSATAVKGYEPQRLSTFNTKGRVQAKKGHSADLQGTLPTVNGVPQYGAQRKSALATAGKLQGQRGLQEQEHDSGCECTACEAKKSGLAEGQKQNELYLANASSQKTVEGMDPPGDCGWPYYVGLQAAVDSATAVSGSLGGCNEKKRTRRGLAPLTCAEIAVRVAAFSSEIAARAKISADCFRGGDEDHKKQIRDKVNAIQNCFALLDSKDCPDDLRRSMEEVVNQIRDVASAVADAVIDVARLIAMVAAAIVVILALLALINALGIAGAIATAVGALLILLNQLRESSPASA